MDAEGRLLASAVSRPFTAGYYLSFSGFALLPDGSIFVTGGHERDNFTAVARTIRVETPALAPSLAIAMVPSVWITAARGTLCTVEYSTALQTQWMNLAEVVVTNVPQPYVDLSPDASKRFYRVRSGP